MKSKISKFNFLIALLLVVGAGAAGAQRQNQPGSYPEGQVSLVEAEDLVFMREEEKLARDSYRVLGEQWDLAIFSNIAKSEQRHMDALEVLIDAFGLVDPVVDNADVGIFADPALQALFDDLTISGMQTEMDALMAGGAIEETDILDIQHAIERAENQDIVATYENLLCGSRNHLRAFVRQIEFYGEVYTPILLSDDELKGIVDFPTERGCGTRKRGVGNGAGKEAGDGSGSGIGNCAGRGGGDGSGACNRGNGGVCG